MSKWDELSLAEKAVMIGAAVRQGYTSLPEIRQKYNQFAEGGLLSDKEYNQSTYSGQKSQYNPLGLPGGFWVGEDFVPMAWQVDANSHSIGGPLVDVANEYAKGGKIHIKPSHRGRLTELKKRTGKSEAELYRTGSAATRKMITFARNARKWKHGEGGNLFDEAGQMQIGQPYYSYDDKGRLVLDSQGKPVLNYNVLLPEVEVSGTNRNYILKAQQERNRQRAIAKNYLTSTPTASNVLNGLEALYKSSPLVTTTSSVNPYIITGVAPTEAIPVHNPLNSTTSNLLKWLGKPLTYKPKTPLSIAPIEKLSSEIIEGTRKEKYPGILQMMDLWESKGVDLSRIGVEDLDDIYRLRTASLMENAPSRVTIADPNGAYIYRMYDYNNGDEVGIIDLLMDDAKNAHMNNIINTTRNKSSKIHGVQKRGLNSAIAVAQSEGGEGVITGQYLQSAPKQYSAIFSHPEREIIGEGLHTNENMVPKGKYGIFGGMKGPREASSVEELWSISDSEPAQLFPAPVWKLTKQSKFTPTKSHIFDPTIIDETGRMHTNWESLNIFKGLSIPILLGASYLYNNKEEEK